jgi:hypothetical protein
MDDKCEVYDAALVPSRWCDRGGRTSWLHGDGDGDDATPADARDRSMFRRIPGFIDGQGYRIQEECIADYQRKGYERPPETGQVTR